MRQEQVVTLWTKMFTEGEADLMLICLPVKSMDNRTYVLIKDQWFELRKKTDRWTKRHYKNRPYALYPITDLEQQLLKV
jgi:hypothetical protein